MTPCIAAPCQMETLRWGVFVFFLGPLQVFSFLVCYLACIELVLSASRYSTLVVVTPQVGVHIADVTHFVLPRTAVDVEAQNRSAGGGGEGNGVKWELFLEPQIFASTLSVTDIQMHHCLPHQPTNRHASRTFGHKYAGRRGDIDANLFLFLVHSRQIYCTIVTRISIVDLAFWPPDLCSLRSNVDRLAFSCIWVGSDNSWHRSWALSLVNRWMTYHRLYRVYNIDVNYY